MTEFFACVGGLATLGAIVTLFICWCTKSDALDDTRATLAEWQGRAKYAERRLDDVRKSLDRQYYDDETTEEE